MMHLQRLEDGRGVEDDSVNATHLLEEHHEASDRRPLEHGPSLEKRDELRRLEGCWAVDVLREALGSILLLKESIGFDL